VWVAELVERACRTQIDAVSGKLDRALEAALCQAAGE
jgi:hypothetical protein